MLGNQIDAKLTSNQNLYKKNILNTIFTVKRIDKYFIN